MKLFGKDIFGYKPEKEERMYNFALWGFAKDHGMIGLIVERQMDELTVSSGAKPAKKKVKKITEKIVLTPKCLYQTKALNNNDFKIITDPEYLQQQIADAKEKLTLMPRKSDKKVPWPEEAEMGAVKFGRQELESIVERLKNRSKLSTVEKIVEKYPHTSSQLISKVLDDNKNLRCESATSFVPDFPKEAISSMKEYDEMCVKICGQKTHFFVIADRKDFEERNKRRDPILLAQSPFGFFWQILGAWDEEMIYLGDL